MENHKKNTLLPPTHQNSNYTLCYNNNIDTWPYLLSTCEHPYLKGFKIARHNKVIHLITQTSQANKNTRFYTLTDACYLNNKPLKQTIPNWLLKCTCSQPTCQCQAKLRPDNLCIIGTPNLTKTPISPSPTHIVQFIKFTYCHNRSFNQTVTHKYTKYDPLISTIHNIEWKTNPLITITSWLKMAIYKHSINKLSNSKNFKSNIKTLMKNVHQITIKYLTYLILDKKKTWQQTNTRPPHLNNYGIICTSPKPTS